MVSPCGQKPLVDMALPQQAIVRALMVSYFHIRYLSFVRGQKVESVGNVAGWWSRELSMWHSRVVYGTSAGSYSKVSSRFKRLQSAISGLSHVLTESWCVVPPSVIWHLVLWALLFPLAWICWLAPHRLRSRSLSVIEKPSFNWPQTFFHYCKSERFLAQILIFSCKIQLNILRRKAEQWPLLKGLTPHLEQCWHSHVLSKKISIHYSSLACIWSLQCLSKSHLMACGDLA